MLDNIGHPLFSPTVQIYFYYFIYPRNKFAPYKIRALLGKIDYNSDMNEYFKTIEQLLFFISAAGLTIYLVSRSRRVIKEVTAEKHSAGGLFFIILLLGIAIILASEKVIDIRGAKVNVRDSVAIFAAIVGGPAAGIAVGLIGGIYRYLMGGWTCLGCAAATFLAGLLAGGIVHITRFKPELINLRTTALWVVFAFFYEFVHLLIFVPLFGMAGIEGGPVRLKITGFIGNSFSFVRHIPPRSFTISAIIMYYKLLFPMSVMNAVSMIVFLTLLKDMVVNNARFKLEAANALINRQLNMARRVQEGLIPREKDFPQIQELAFGCDYAALDNIGGDIFDVFMLDKNRYSLLIADVSGHGVPSALITIMSKIFFHTHGRSSDSPAEVCRRVNTDIFRLVGDLGYYLTAFYGILDLESGIFKYSNCGHPPALLCREREKKIEKLDTAGFFIGSLADSEYYENSVRLENGDSLCLYTDGVIEAKNKKKLQYEISRLEQLIINNSSLHPCELVKCLIADMKKFTENTPAADDCSVLCIKVFRRNS
ncbi:MAG: hypothetical protein A2096_07990 [Spirochaetes bacterium GWF1_41_5]|nr:MAG: hypothetical protein A2096_07990 [Spirochaetes bacterium GWF1_41_5]HBE04297.1 hypothetical protein [Spirochaetia bacterium]